MPYLATTSDAAMITRGTEGVNTTIIHNAHTQVCNSKWRQLLHMCLLWLLSSTTSAPITNDINTLVLPATARDQWKTSKVNGVVLLVHFTQDPPEPSGVMERKHYHAGSKGSTIVFHAIASCNTCTLHNQPSPNSSPLTILEKPTDDLERLIAHMSEKASNTSFCLVYHDVALCRQ
ncbi:hypothetical protein MHU86_17702 [Fragilaria crotonensis]|nr:hypothetical protein MHU86_17702 [Fragilaria crotonensis]